MERRSPGSRCSRARTANAFGAWTTSPRRPLTPGRARRSSGRPWSRRGRRPTEPAAEGLSTLRIEDVDALEVHHDLRVIICTQPRTRVDPGEQLGLAGEHVEEHLCLLYTSDAADDLLCVDLGGRRII